MGNEISHNPKSPRPVKGRRLYASFINHPLQRTSTCQRHTNLLHRTTPWSSGKSAVSIKPHRHGVPSRHTRSHNGGIPSDPTLQIKAPASSPPNIETDGHAVRHRFFAVRDFYRKFQALRLGSDFQKHATRTGLAPSPARWNFTVLPTVFVIAFTYLFHTDIISRIGQIVK